MKAGYKVILIIAVLALLAAAPLASHPSSESVSQALSSTVIERFAVTDVPVSVALSVIETEFRHQHPEMGDIQLITGFYTYPPELARRPDLMTLDLRKIPADEALRELADLSGHRFVVSGGSIYFVERDRPVTLSERFAVQRRELYWRLQGLARNAMERVF